MITLTKIKLAGGDETPRFEATLCWNGKPVAAVSNGGTGGACRVWWAAPARRIEDVVVTYRDTILAVLREASREAKRLEPALYAHLDPEADPFARHDGEDALSFVCMHEVELSRHIKALDRACKSRVLTRCPGQAEGAYYTISVPPTPAEIAGVKSRYPGHIVLNELSSRERAERIMRAEPAPPESVNPLTRPSRRD